MRFALFSHLRGLRKRPAEVVALREMARVGAGKAERHGPALCAAIADFAEREGSGGA